MPQLRLRGLALRTLLLRPRRRLAVVQDLPPLVRREDRWRLEGSAVGRQAVAVQLGRLVQRRGEHIRDLVRRERRARRQRGAVLARVVKLVLDAAREGIVLGAGRDLGNLPLEPLVPLLRPGSPVLPPEVDLEPVRRLLEGEYVAQRRLAVVLHLARLLVVLDPKVRGGREDEHARLQQLPLVDGRDIKGGERRLLGHVHLAALHARLLVARPLPLLHLAQRLCQRRGGRRRGDCVDETLGRREA
mmetsp:Transcript_46111/g.148537  ORF Transcript_46111/g.148537 Transcript_46111/m.148537 type:complete len:245 (+) Transcript_46111:244-978(+)